ncbi:hypothetical protein ES703_109033 [subsurface metagenome]
MGFQLHRPRDGVEFRLQYTQWTDFVAVPEVAGGDGEVALKFAHRIGTLPLQRTGIIAEAFPIAADEGRSQVRLRWEVVVDSGVFNAELPRNVVVTESVKSPVLQQGFGCVQD